MNRPSCYGTTAKQNTRYRDNKCINCPYILDCVEKEKMLDQTKANPSCFGTQPTNHSVLYAERRCGFCDVNTTCKDATSGQVDKVETPIGTKLDKGKPRWSLIPVGVMHDIIAVLEFGAVKYSPGNWQFVESPHTRYYDAAMRHIDARADGEKMDPDSGLPHLAHAICCLMFLMWFEARGKC